MKKNQNKEVCGKCGGELDEVFGLCIEECKKTTETPFTEIISDEVLATMSEKEFKIRPDLFISEERCLNTHSSKVQKPYKPPYLKMM